MKIKVNGSLMDIPTNTSIMGLLKLIGSNNWVAVYVNEKQILQSDYSNIYLNEKDKVLIIRPLSGG